MSVVVRPVDSVPPQLVLGGPLVVVAVGSGTAVRLTAEVISAWDFDSGEGDLTFVVYRNPLWGSLVRSSGRTSRSERSEARHSAAAAGAASFTLPDLKDGAIQYLQSSQPLPPNGRGARLLSDSFLVYVTDGKQNSTVGKVEVAVVNNSTTTVVHL